MAKKIILDVDTGSDDAVAIMLAALHPDIDLLGVCAVNGNLPLKNTLENTLRVIELVGVQDKVPVAKGCARPMVKDLLPGREHNPYTKPYKIDENGNYIGYHHPYFDLPESVTKPVKENFITWYIDTIKNCPEKVTLVPVGPLTNIGMLLRADPTVLDNVEEIVIMGGGHAESNHSAAGEFNIWADPEAAEIVMQSGAKITLVPLDCTHKVSRVSRSDFGRFKEIGNPVSDFILQLLEDRIAGYKAIQPGAMEDDESAALHDVLCVAYCIDPSVLDNLLTTRVDVDFSGGFADGKTVIDTRHNRDLPDNCTVAFGGDREKFLDILLDACKNYR